MDLCGAENECDKSGLPVFLKKVEMRQFAHILIRPMSGLSLFFFFFFGLHGCEFFTRREACRKAWVRN